MMMFTVLLVGCTQNDSKLLIFDDNALILEEGDAFTYSVRTESNEIIANQFDLSFRGFSGKETIFTLKTTQPTTLSLQYLSTLSSGQFKVVIVTPDNEVFTLLSGSDDDTSTISLQSGIYKIKLVGKTAFGTISLTLSDIEKVSIEK